MKQFIITEEERKRILSMHESKKNINSILFEDTEKVGFQDLIGKEVNFFKDKGHTEYETGGRIISMDKNTRGQVEITIQRINLEFPDAKFTGDISFLFTCQRPDFFWMEDVKSRPGKSFSEENAVYCKPFSDVLFKRLCSTSSGGAPVPKADFTMGYNPASKTA